MSQPRVEVIPVPLKKVMINPDREEKSRAGAGRTFFPSPLPEARTRIHPGGNPDLNLCLVSDFPGPPQLLHYFSIFYPVPAETEHWKH
jgi:hypothetical protein